MLPNRTVIFKHKGRWGHNSRVILRHKNYIRICWNKCYFRGEWTGGYIYIFVHNDGTGYNEHSGLNNNNR